jgi:hypothetical protein
VHTVTESAYLNQSDVGCKGSDGDHLAAAGGERLAFGERSFDVLQRQNVGSGRLLRYHAVRVAGHKHGELEIQPIGQQSFQTIQRRVLQETTRRRKAEPSTVRASQVRRREKPHRGTLPNKNPALTDQHTDTQLFAYIHIHKYIYTISTHLHTRTYTLVYTRTYIRTCTLTYTLAYVRRYNSHACTHIYSSQQPQKIVNNTSLTSHHLPRLG